MIPMALVYRQLSSGYDSLMHDVTVPGAEHCVKDPSCAAGVIIISLV